MWTGYLSLETFPVSVYTMNDCECELKKGYFDDAN